jgi:hypothetical protein
MATSPVALIVRSASCRKDSLARSRAAATVRDVTAFPS